MDSQTLESQLYKTLGEIGRKKRAIAPWILEEHAPLFRHCPQITGRARAEVHSSLANAAHHALLAAITALPTKTERLVAEAILGVGLFEGESVDARKRIVANTKPHGCSENSYKHHRPLVLRQIVRFLLTPPVQPQSPAVASLTQSLFDGSPAPITRYDLCLLDLAYNACELQYNALAGVFIYDFLPTLKKNYGLRFAFRRLPYEVWRSCCEELFRRYLDFLSWSHHLFTDDLELKRLRRKLKPSAINDLDALCRQCVACGPAELSELKEFEPYGLYPGRGEDIAEVDDAEPVFDAYQYPQGHRDYGRSDSEALELLYVTVWEHWYSKQVPIMPLSAFLEIQKSPETPTALETMAGKAAAIFRAVAEHMDWMPPYVVTVRRQTSRDIMHHFAFEDWERHFDGRSLKDNIEVFWAEKEAELAK